MASRIGKRLSKGKDHLCAVHVQPHRAQRQAIPFFTPSTGYLWLCAIQQTMA